MKFRLLFLLLLLGLLACAQTYHWEGTYCFGDDCRTFQGDSTHEECPPNVIIVSLSEKAETDLLHVPGTGPIPQTQSKQDVETYEYVRDCTIEANR